MNRSECKPEDHYFRPLVDITVPPDKWYWSCTKCSYTSINSPGVVSRVTLRDLERMVDDSLKIADRVILDDQGLRGDLWYMRNSIWLYRPQLIQIVYHVFHGHAFVILFKYRHEMSDTWTNILDTKYYRKILNDADVWRSAQ